MHSTLDRLEARLDYQVARIDELYRRLDALGLRDDDEPLFDELVQLEDAPFVGEPRVLPSHRTAHVRVGEASGV